MYQGLETRKNMTQFEKLNDIQVAGIYIECESENDRE